MIKLSVVIITFNEEKNIERCLQSIEDVADEIVVVDSYSKDKTEAICKQYKVKFIEHPFEGHIQQKNYAITQASYPHILSLDADEALSDELKKNILIVKKNWKHDGYYFNRLTNYCGKWIRHTGWYPDRKLRLWDSRKGKWGGVNPHDKYILENNSTQAYLKGDLYHYSFYTISQHMDQVNKFSDIRAKEMLAQNKKVSLLKIIFAPVVKFLKHYFLKSGFMDGYYGFVISINSAHASFLKYAKLRQLKKDA